MRIKGAGTKKFSGGVRYYHRHAEGRDVGRAALHWREHQVNLVRIRRRRMIGVVGGLLLIAAFVGGTFYLLLL